jgi:hypothetical protein
MSLSPEERQEIIHAACEKALLLLPEVVGNLMTQHAALLDMNRDFYKAHADFAAHKPIVQSVIEQIEGTRPTANYKDILEAAIPLITERIKIQTGLDMTTVKRPDRHLPNLGVERDPLKPFGEL